MKSLIKYTLSLFIFWLLVFFFNRLFFVIYQMPIGNKIKNGNDLYLAFIKGYPLDFSTSTMLVLIPMLVALIYYIFHIEGIKNTLPKVIGTLLIIYIAVSLSLCHFHYIIISLDHYMSL